MEHGPRYRYALVIHARRLVCECGHAFTLKREARITANSPVKPKKGLKSMDDTLRIHEKNRMRMASMRGSLMQEQTLERQEQNRTRISSMRASETLHVKLHKKTDEQGSYGQCTYKDCACRRCHCCIPF